MNSSSRILLGLAFLGPLAACTDTPVTLPLRSLERSGEVSFLCLSTTDPNGDPGRSIDDCPDFDFADDETDNNRLLALVTQTVRGEVAVIDVSSGGGVLDADPAVPGFGFLPIGAQPVDIVSTPGGKATFVGVAEFGKEGIFALPTTCIRAPEVDEPPRELTTWPACSLPSAPGEMTILIDPPSEEGLLRTACGAAYDQTLGLNDGFDPGRESCLADLSTETQPPGRRVLAVALPERGEIALIDAQTMLNSPQGSFAPCLIERFITLDPDPPAVDVEQNVPEDLQVSDPACEPSGFNHGPPAGEFSSRPSALALSDGLLYVADRGAPKIHRLDVSDPCATSEQPALLPVEYGDSQVHTSTDVAVSPVLSDGRRFAYAIDDEGRVMVFDVSLGSGDRTPIVREASPSMPFEPPDRIAFDAPARAVEIILRDEPIVDPNTGVALIGDRCDPDPNLDPDAPGAEYRSNSDLTVGAGPGKLRGVFGMVALTSGQIAVIDIEDYDSPCRRPVQANGGASEENFRGCQDAAGASTFEDADGISTVTGEDSCNVVRPHRTRSGTFFKTSSSSGVRSPSLRALPRLTRGETALNNSTETEEGRNRPRLLAVGFPDGTPAQVFVGSRLNEASPDADVELVTDPNVAVRNSLTLIPREPRAFPATEDFALTFEGPLFTERPAGFIQEGGLELQDSGGAFCNRGVQDIALAAEFARLDLQTEDQSVADQFGATHADYVQITSSLPGEDDSHWDQGVGPTCGGATAGAGFFECRSTFGSPDAPTDGRDLRIDEAYQGRLVISPREATGADAERLSGMLRCCFPGAVSYVVRGGGQWILQGSSTGFGHQGEVGEDDRCSRGCDPLNQHRRSRAVEVVDVSIATDLDAEPAPVVCAKAGALPASDSCVFENLTSRFAVYRGALASERDMLFTWTVGGGFVPLSASLAVQSAQVSPVSMQFVPQLGQLAVTDGATQGLLFVSMTSVRVTRLFF